MPKTNPEPPRGLGLTLKHHRTMAKLSQDQLAYESGVEQSTIRRIESSHPNSTTSPQDGTLWSLAEALAQNIPHSDAQVIYQRFINAKRQKPVDIPMHPALLQINDLIQPLPAPKQFLIIETLLKVTEAFIQFHKK